VGFAGANICVRTCASRATPRGVSKCLDRSDVVCVSVAALGDEPPGAGPQRGVCLPSCQSDAQCGPGLFCDLGNGLCTSERPAGDPVGSVCAGAESCASGLCVTLPGFRGLSAPAFAASVDPAAASTAARLRRARAAPWRRYRTRAWVTAGFVSSSVRAPAIVTSPAPRALPPARAAAFVPARCARGCLRW
jgi:hypothetical protein